MLLAGALALGGWSAHEQQRQVAGYSRAHRDFVPNVRVAEVKASNDTVTVSLPGTTSPYTTANIFARASGYIDKRNVDIGDHVKQGQLLAEITSPPSSITRSSKRKPLLSSTKPRYARTRRTGISRRSL